MVDIEDLPDKEGYKEPYPYPIEKWKLHIFSSFLFISLGMILGENFLPLLNQGETVFALVMIPLLIASELTNTHLHEPIHFKMWEMMGYAPEVTYSKTHLQGFVNTPGQFVDAEENILNLLGPLTALGFFYSFFLILDLHWFIQIVFSVLLILNTAGSGGDIIGVIFDYYLPDSSFVYYPESGEKESYIYEPIPTKQ